uniref:Auxin response factor n=2 Tax=Cajanus cajan TaxID=3821 RepID=A0A151RY77_CAJCA|nr:Auxin response factor 17 [Cajanus cajan]
MEHASPSHSPSLEPLLRSLPFVPCHVSSIDLLADPYSDEVFAKLTLTPFPFHHNNANDHQNDHQSDVVSFSKILTPSDANNGGGFSVPRYCADSIFPPLDFRADPPYQYLSITDVHGVAWRFRHIYRGTPRRHLFTTGWSKFVNHKKLVAGDSVVFMRDSEGRVSVGIRRAARFAMKSEAVEVEAAEGAGFSRSTTGRVSPKAVAAAAEAAARNEPFEVVYYPRAGFADFVVSAEVVDEAMKYAWVGGTRVKIGIETEDSSRMTWFQGMVASACATDNGPWRMLQVIWDEPEVLQNAKRVSPWQVELASPTLALHTVFPPTKRFRADQGSGLLGEREGDPFPMSGLFPNSTMGHLNKKMFCYDTFPAGMQGARHDLFSATNFSNFLNDNSYLYLGSSSLVNNTVQRLETVSTELNIGSSQSDDLSPHSQSSLHSSCTEFTGTHNSNTKVGSGSILLFGKIIHPVEYDLHDADCVEEGDRSKETEGSDNLLE